MNIQQMIQLTLYSMVSRRCRKHTPNHMEVHDHQNSSTQLAEAKKRFWFHD